jgi:excisionase family DNA binding protein
MSLEDTVRTLIREEVQRVLREELPAAIAELRPASDAGEQYLSVDKAAAIADVHPDTVRTWVKSGRLPEHRAGRELRILRSDLRRFLASVSANGHRASAEQEAVAILARRRSG